MDTTEYIKATYRMPDSTLKTIEEISESTGKSRNDIVVEAVLAYCDYYYMEKKATVIPEHIMLMVDAALNRLESRINNKVNQTLSTVGIESGVIVQILSRSLEIPEVDIATYYRNAVDYMKRNNRVLRLTDILPEEGRYEE